jgi:RNA polymerase sigma-70 factor (ECF subfamily)
VSLAVLERVAREAGGRIVSALAARFRDIGVAEDAFGDACVRAAEAWPTYGIPFDPAGWLYRTAERKALDAFRRRRTRERLLPDPPASPPTPEDALIDDARIIPDERLRLIFVCCHPAVPADSRAALTLRLVCGLSVAEIARAFLVSESTLAQRLVRAKRKIAEAGVPFEVPRPEAWNERLEAVLSTLEIAYAKSYEDAAGEGDRAGYATEVLELTRLLAEMVPDEPGAHALAALVRYTEARRPARVDEQGAMVPLSEQDPTLWRRPLIEEADLYLKRSWALRFPSPRAIQAAIHGTWCWRKSLDEPPPWINVAALYDELIKYRDDAVVRLNRAVALAEVAGPEAAMSEIDALDSKELQNCLPYHAVRADLLRRLHQIPAALTAYDAALALDPGPAERLWLERTKALVAQRLTLFASTPSDSHNVADRFAMAEDCLRQQPKA